MIFLLQTDDVSVIEKRVVRAASMLSGAKLFFASLNQVSYNNLDPDIPVDAVPVGSVEFVQAVMGCRGIALPPHFSYPLPLLESQDEFFCRRVYEGVFGAAPEGAFVKPRHAIKQFTGCLSSTLPEGVEITPDFQVWISEPVKFTSEWRYYILNGSILGAGRYDDLFEDNLPEPDTQLVLSAVSVLKDAGFHAAAYSIDAGVPKPPHG